MIKNEVVLKKDKKMKVIVLILLIALLISCNGDKGVTDTSEENGNGHEEDIEDVVNPIISMVAPFVSQSHIASINEAFSTSDNSPWGFEHLGIDFFPDADLRPFLAASSGTVDMIELWQNEISSNWQVSIRLIYNSTYSLSYAFEPMTSLHSDGQNQLDNILITVNQTVSQGDTIGYLHTAGGGAHVDFGLLENWEPVCPESYFTPEARESILELIQVVWPGAGMCY